jgi:hypothetical protein
MQLGVYIAERALQPAPLIGAELLRPRRFGPATARVVCRLRRSLHVHGNVATRNAAAGQLLTQNWHTARETIRTERANEARLF